MNTKIKICPAIQPYIDYWNEWHKEWYINASSKPPKLTPIKNWPIPANKNDIWRYFPEPYWGNPNPSELTAVFLNLNPAGGGEGQNIITSAKDPIATYMAKQQVYSDTVGALINNPCYPTTDWFIKNRVHWINCLLHQLKKESDKTIDNIIAGELVPWHTKNVSEIRKYINANINLIVNHCIKPLADISQCAALKGVVFCRGVEIAHALNKVTTEKACYTSTNGFTIHTRTRIHIFEFHGAIFIVFVGRRNMILPTLTELYNDPKSSSVLSVFDIINNNIKQK